MHLKPFLKRAFWVGVIAAPVFWLVFTMEGQQFVDVTILKLTGRETMRIKFDELRPSIREEQLHKVWPDLELKCEDRVSAFGSRLCAAPIAGFNGTPARYVTFFLAEDQLRAMKIGLQRPYHEATVGQLRQMLGSPMESTREDGGVYQWRAGGGIMVITQRPAGPNEEPALLWLATAP